MNDDGESYPAVVSSYAILGDVTEIKVFIYLNNKYSGQFF